MTILGALVFIISLETSTFNWIFAGLYVFYGIAGALWIIIFVGPYCHFYGTRAYPCGYGKISAELCNVRDQSRFDEKFKKHIPMIIPLCVIPMVAGIIFLIQNLIGISFLRLRQIPHNFIHFPPVNILR